MLAARFLSFRPRGGLSAAPLALAAGQATSESEDGRRVSSDLNERAIAGAHVVAGPSQLRP